jgi:hypothetical protein
VSISALLLAQRVGLQRQCMGLFSTKAMPSPAGSVWRQRCTSQLKPHKYARFRRQVAQHSQACAHKGSLHWRKCALSWQASPRIQNTNSAFCLQASGANLSSVLGFRRSGASVPPNLSFKGEAQRRATRARSAVRCTFSPTGPACPAVGLPLNSNVRHRIHPSFRDQPFEDHIKP